MEIFMADHLSYLEYACDGETDTFAVSFLYLEREDVHADVTYDGTVQEDVAFTWVTQGIIQLASKPVNGSTVKIYRATDKVNRLIDFSDGSTLREWELDDAFRQTFYIVQELSDQFTDLYTFVRDVQLGNGLLPTPTIAEQNGYMLVTVDGVWTPRTPAQTRTSLELGTAALKNTGTEATQVPLNSDLGTASKKDTGTGATQVPTNADLGSASTKTAGSAVGNVPLLVDVGGGVAGLPALDASLLTNVPVDAKYVLAVHQADYNVDGGSVTGGDWETRPLTNIRVDETSGCSIASNKITVPAGTYWFRFICPVRQPPEATDGHVARLVIGDPMTSAMPGMTGLSNPLCSQASVGVGKITLATATALSLQHFAPEAFATSGWGKAHGVSGVPNVYTTLELWKVE